MNNNRAILIADLGFGDAGKGSIVDALTRSTGAKTVIRYNGGAQAARVRLDRRDVAQVLEPLMGGDADPLLLLLDVRHSVKMPAPRAQRW